MNPTSAMLIDLARPWLDAPRCLVLGGEVDLIEEIVADGGRPTWLPTDIRELQALASPRNLDIVRDPLEAFAGQAPFDLVLIPVPQARNLTRRWMALTNRVAAGGQVVLAGPNQAGIKSAERDAILLWGNPVTQGYGNHQRGTVHTVPEQSLPLPSWLDESGIKPGTFGQIEVTSPSITGTLHTLPGVFSSGRLDEGTNLLLSKLALNPGAHVLDVGCGCGVIGMAAMNLGATAVDMIDANLLAVASARRNTLGNQRFRVVASDVYDALGHARYNLIVSNPPFHQGKDIDGDVAARLIDQAPEHLLPGGLLQIVANAFLPYKARMERVFKQVGVMSKTRQYQVLLAGDPR